MIKMVTVFVFLLTSCRDRKPVDACGNDPKCLPVTIGGSMTVACRCFDHPVRQISERP